MYVCIYVPYVHVCVRDCVIKQSSSEPYSPDYVQPVVSTFTLNPLTPIARGYEQISSGTCASRGLVTITSATECKEAVKALGRTVSSVRTSTSHLPPWGCYYDPSSGSTYVNTNAGNKNGRKATAQYQSVCAGETNV